MFQSVETRTVQVHRDRQIPSIFFDVPVLLLALAPPVKAQVLDTPVFQFQQQALSTGYFNWSYNTAGASDMPEVTV